MSTTVVLVPTPLGTFGVRLVDGAAHAAWFGLEPSPGEPAVTTGPVAEAVAAYFAGDLAALDAIPAAAPGSAFQRRVWAALRDIPPGHTASYADLATAVGTPGAARAVGRANASNPVGVIVPCHRVVRADGSIGGYAGGVERKQWLLRHEHARAPRGAAPVLTW